MCPETANPSQAIEQAILARFRQPVLLAERSGEIVYANPRAKEDFRLTIGSHLVGRNEVETGHLLRTLIMAASADIWTPLNLGLPGNDEAGDLKEAKFLASCLRLSGRAPLVILIGDTSRDVQFARLNLLVEQLDKEKAANVRLNIQLRKAMERIDQLTQSHADGRPEHA